MLCLVRLLPKGVDGLLLAVFESSLPRAGPLADSDDGEVLIFSIDFRVIAVNCSISVADLFPFECLNLSLIYRGDVVW